MSWGPDDAGAVRSLFPLRESQPSARSNGQYLGLGSFLDAFFGWLNAHFVSQRFPKTPHRFVANLHAKFAGAEAEVGMRAPAQEAIIMYS
jgi:hypothetical protein